MRTAAPPIIASNPFATCKVRPGAIPYLFEEENGLGSLVDRLAGNGWWGEIVGPHGSGKSTLLVAIVQELSRRNVHVVRHRLSENSPRLPSGWRSTLRPMDSERTQPVLVVDGFERLGRWRRGLVKRRCQLMRCGLIVTAHEPVGLPPFVQTRITTGSARRVIGHLMPEAFPFLSEDELLQLLQRRAFNLREVLFDLYDVFEQKKRAGLTPRSITADITSMDAMDRMD
jgi:GTPase SAR1 family protein